MREDWPAHRQNKMDAHAKGGVSRKEMAISAVVVGIHHTCCRGHHAARMSITDAARDIERP